MGLTETQWRGIQIRGVDPYSSYFSDNVNRHTRIVSAGKDCIITGLKCTYTKDNHKIITCPPGICIKDDVMLQFLNHIDIDVSDPDWYIDANVVNEACILYVVVVYKYAKVKPPPYARILLCRPDQYDTSGHLFLNAVSIDFFDATNDYGVTGIYDFDPNNKDIERQHPTFIDQLRGIPNGFASLDENGHVLPEELWIDDTDKSNRILWSSEKIYDELQEVEKRAINFSLTSEYDPYQDWLLGSKFSYVACDTFVTPDLIDYDKTTATVDLDNARIVGEAGQQFQSKQLNTFAADAHLDTCAIAVKFTGNIKVFVSVDGGSTWDEVGLNDNGISDNHVLQHSGNDLRIRIFFQEDSIVYNYGILFGDDLSVETIDVADITNAICWTPPQVTMPAHSNIELTRIKIPTDKLIHIRRVTMTRLDGPLSVDLKVQFFNVTDNAVVQDITGSWWEGDIVLTSSKDIAIKVINDSNYNAEMCVTITGQVVDI